MGTKSSKSSSKDTSSIGSSAMGSSSKSGGTPRAHANSAAPPRLSSKQSDEIRRPIMSFSQEDSVLHNRPRLAPANDDSVARLLSSVSDAYEVVDEMIYTWQSETAEEQGVFAEEKRSGPGSFALSRAVTEPQTITPTAQLKSKDPGFFKDEGFMVLPRGGYLVETEALGNVQFGIPPETIKDTLAKGMKVPEVYCILSEMFDRKLGLSKAEFEFPIYYRYFVCRSRATIVTTQAFEERIRVALRETLFGPGAECNVREDYPSNTPDDALPNFEAEAESLDPDRTKTRIDDVVRFVRYDPVHGAELDGVTIKPKTIPDANKGGMKLVYEVCEKGKVLAVVPVAIKLKTNTFVVGSNKAQQLDKVRAPGSSKRELTSTKRELRQRYEDEEKRRLKDRTSFAEVEDLTQAMPAPLVPQQSLPQFAPFDIPVFGLTMMGASHGFDFGGRTTGFVLWMNRRGIMIDPPPDSSGILEVMGVPPRAIDAVMLTHTHADHDAGTFQRILRTRQIKLYATRTVEKSFIRKYAAITGFDEAFLRSMFVYVPILCHSPLQINGGELRFFYSLHTIPCVGFEAYYGNKSLAYSADTRFDPDMVLGLAAQGKIGQARAQQLSNFNFNHTIVLHELGVPPIHTPQEALLKASIDPRHIRNDKLLRERLFIVHAGKTDKEKFPHQCSDWDTIRILVEQGHDNRQAEISSLLANVPWLEPMGEDAVDRLAKQSTVREFDVGDVIVEFVKGEPSDCLYIVMAGVAVQEFREKKPVRAGMSRRQSALESFADATEKVTSVPVGGSFGEEGLLHDLDSLDTIPVLKIPGVPLPSMSIPILAGTTRAVLDVFKTTEGLTPKVPHLSLSTASRRVVAKSKLFVVEVKNKTLLKLLKGSARHEVHVLLKRFAGYPEDDRWRCLTRNAPLMKLLDQQLAVIDFLGCMSEDFADVPEGHMFQDGRSNEPVQYGYVVREGLLRVTPMNAAFSFRGVESMHTREPFDVGRGTLVLDVNALLKNSKSPYRITAVEPSQVFVVPRAELLKVLETYPGLKFQFLDRVHIGWSLDVVSPLTSTSDSIDVFGGVQKGESMF